MSTHRIFRFSSLERKQHCGSALLLVLTTIAILASISAVTLAVARSRYHANYQATGWNEALDAAESGVEYGVARLSAGITLTGVDPLIVPGSLQQEINATWSSGTPRNGTASTNQDGFTSIELPSTTLTHGGEGSSQQMLTVAVDRVPPARITNTIGSPWYRVRATGTVPLTGAGRISEQKYDQLLRKLRFFSSAGQRLAAPQAVRTVEAIVRPTSIFSAALFSQTGMHLSSHNVSIDAYDSRFPGEKSDANGKYPLGTDSASVALRLHLRNTLQEADVVSNDIASSGLATGINLSDTGANIYGQVTGNTVMPMGSSANVHYSEDPANKVGTGFYQELTAPPNPGTSPTSSVWTTPTQLNSITYNSLAAGTQSSPRRYKLSGNLLLDDKRWNVTAPASGQGYVEFWITGSATVTGNGAINIPPNVHATFYINGNVDFAGNGVVNQSFIPKNVIIYGNPDPNSTQTISIRGNGAFAGQIYAPYSRLSIEGGGTTGDLFGAFVGRYINFTGQTVLHYDVALGDEGILAGYRIVSWYEDNTFTR